MAISGLLLSWMQRIAELKGIAKAKRTPEQVAELAELLED